MAKENISQELRLKTLDKTRNYLIEEIIQKWKLFKLFKMNWWAKSTRRFIKLYWTLILSSRITGCVSISAFVSLVGIPIGITISAIRLKICAISAVIKKYKSLIKKKKNKQDKTIFSSKSKMNRIEVVISKVLIDSVISPDDFF